MTAFQDAYYQAVSVLEGLSRAGPRRRRLTRQQWQTEKAASLAIAVSLERASKANEQMAKIMMDRASLDRDRASLDKDLASLEACSESVLRTIDRLEEVEAEQTLEKERLSKRAEALTETHDIASEFLRDLHKIAGLDWQKQRDIRDGLKELVEELKPKKPLSEHERIVRSIEAQMSHAGVKDPFKDAGPEV